MKKPIKEEIGMDKFQNLVTNIVKLAIEDLQFDWRYYVDSGKTNAQQRADDARTARCVISAYRFLKNGGYNDYLEFIDCKSKLIDDGINYTLKKYKKNYNKANKIMDIRFSTGLKEAEERQLQKRQQLAEQRKETEKSEIINEYERKDEPYKKYCKKY